ncbi:MAG: hypothetical protein IT165_16490 [Bryobacterales bacterium]|nr:hypothetical protein [Bryobacterales bacterium]
MNVHLGPVLDEFVADLLKIGREIAIGGEQADRGQFVDGESAFDAIRKRSSARRKHVQR